MPGIPFNIGINAGIGIGSSGSPSWTPRYYVSNAGNDANDGLTAATAWQTIAKVNATSFVPGDKIGFKKGDIWKEALIIPSSGEYGNLITFGAYGNSAQNGKAIPTWTDYSSIGNIGDSTQGTAAGTRLGNYVYFFKVTATVSGKVSTVKIYVGASGTGNAKAAIYSSSGIAPLHVLTNGTSDQISMSINAWKTFTFSTPPDVVAGTVYYIGIATASNYGATISGTGGVYTTGHKAYAYDGTFPDSPAWSQSALTDFDVYMTVSSNANIWHSNEPSIITSLLFDASAGTKKTSITTLTTDLDWYQSGADVYCYSTSDPDTRFGAVTGDITGIKPIIDGNGAQTTITAPSNTSYIKFDGLSITDTGVIHATQSSVTIPTGATNWTIQNCNIYGVATKKIRFGVYAVVDSGGYHTVQNNQFYDISTRAVYFYTPSDTADPSHLKWGITVTNNTFKRITGGGSGAEFAIVGTYNAGSVISHNYVYDSCHTNGDNHAFYLYHMMGTIDNPVLITHNWIDLCGGDDIQLQVYHTSQYVDISYNIISNSSKGIGIGIVDTGIVDYVNIYNNTICNLNSLASSGITLDYTAHCNVKNNLLYEVMGSLSPDRRTRYNLYISPNAIGPIVFDKNLVYAANPFVSGGSPTYAYYGATDYTNAVWNALNDGKVMVVDDVFNSNPLLVSPSTLDFHLQVGSPAINAGVDVGLTKDYEGNPIVGIPDMGCYEKQ